MLPIKPKAVYLKSEAADDPRSMARVERMLPFMEYEGEPVVVDDAGLERVIVEHGLHGMARHGRDGQQVEPVVIFNQFLYHHTPEQRRRRAERYPQLAGGRWGGWYAGYLGFDWRESGDPEYRQRTGLVCQPAYALHTFWGCHYRCAYCNLGHVANIYCNVEDWIEHVRGGLAELPNAPDQTLFQWDNGTDVSCWEPEYGATEQLVNLFAEQADKHLLVYVGKSEHVDYMLDFDHRGQTTCCWSVSTEAQTRLIEPRTASMEARLQAARKCQQAGYPVRIRFSPMVPVADWQAETRKMVRRMFELISPDVLTIEPLRFCTYQQAVNLFAPGVLDPEYLDSLKSVGDDADDWQRNQFPDELRLAMYRVVLDEVAAASPNTPVALCREKRRIWEALGDDFRRMGQDPDRYVCNCGPTSAGAHPLLAR